MLWSLLEEVVTGVLKPHNKKAFFPLRWWLREPAGALLCSRWVRSSAAAYRVEEAAVTTAGQAVGMVRRVLQWLLPQPRRAASRVETLLWWIFIAFFLIKQRWYAKYLYNVQKTTFLLLLLGFSTQKRMGVGTTGSCGAGDSGHVHLVVYSFCTFLKM